MKRILLFTFFALFLLLLSASAASAFGMKDVIRMHQDGVADSLIVQKIYYSGKTFHLDAGDMHALKEAGVSDEVISAMLRTEADYDSGDYSYDYGPGDYYPHSRLYLGFGLGYGAWWPYYGSYWYPGYYPYYAHHYYGGRHGYYGYYDYPYDRYYFHRGSTGYHSPTGQYGDTRYRGTVGNRINTGNRGYTGYRERSTVTPPSSGTRTRRR